MRPLIFESADVRQAGAYEAALVPRGRSGVGATDGGAVRQERQGIGWSTVIGQRAEFRIEPGFIGRSTLLIVRGKTGAAIRTAEQVVSLTGDRAVYIRPGGNAGTRWTSGGSAYGRIRRKDGIARG